MKLHNLLLSSSSFVGKQGIQLNDLHCWKGDKERKDARYRHGVTQSIIVSWQLRRKHLHFLTTSHNLIGFKDSEFYREHVDIFEDTHTDRVCYSSCGAMRPPDSLLTITKLIFLAKLTQPYEVRINTLIQSSCRDPLTAALSSSVPAQFIFISELGHPKKCILIMCF
jgi:hypothetical protein